MGEEKPYLTIGKAVARLHKAGYGDTADQVRAAIDKGVYGAEGRDWYRTESGYRMVRPAAVDAVIARRRASPAAE